MSAPKLIVLDDAASLFVHAAEEIAHVAGEAVCTHGEFTFCLTGGLTPEPTYELLASRFHHSIDWSEAQFFWGDERCVPPDDPASNFAMANRTLLSKLELRPEQIHRMRGEDPPETAARAYEDHLRTFFHLDPGAMPVFNLVLLGLGENAHIASLFPHHPALAITDRLAVAIEVDAPQRHRITLTAPILNQAARIIFLVAGESKAAAVKAVLEGPRDPESAPAQLIAPPDGDVTWMLDRAAARLLS
ncbi:MAG TPA: 6-phosphogluconolactonase [Candidatus Binataceae bacterium]|nr:6-phosphogluconolactonase [Candidatus Binataceae bacterium]